jgi:hypothetical protein
MKLQTRPRATQGNSLSCPKPPQRSFNIDQSHYGDVRTSKIYRSNNKSRKLPAYPGKLQTYPAKLQTYPGKLHNPDKFHNSMKPRLLHPIASTKMTEFMHFNSRAIILDNSNDLINRIPAHKIIFDFPVVVLLLFAALYKALIFTISFLWQAIMARIKTRLRDRIRRMHGTTIKTTFITPNTQTNIIQLRNLEKKILHNLGLIQQFNLNNANGPSSSNHALLQRQKYHVIKENCNITKCKIQYALSLANKKSTCAHAYRGIFTTLQAMLLNEIIRADMIQEKALTYWYELNVPEPPPFPKPVTQIPNETLAQRLGLPSDDEASSITSGSTPDSPMYSPTSYSSQSSD